MFYLETGTVFTYEPVNILFGNRYIFYKGTGEYFIQEPVHTFI